MKRIAVIVAVLGSLSSPALARIRVIPLPELVCDADAIVRGKLTGTKAHFLSITMEREGSPRKVFFDRAELAGAKVLKTHRKVNPGAYQVMFLSPDDPDVAVMRKYSEGSEGIWFLYRDGLGLSLFSVAERYPAHREAEILRIMANAKCEAKSD